jgi:hypothetical protein
MNVKLFLMDLRDSAMARSYWSFCNNTHAAIDDGMAGLARYYAVELVHEARLLAKEWGYNFPMEDK